MKLGCYEDRDDLIAFCLGQACGAVRETSSSGTTERCPLTNLEFNKDNKREHYKSLIHAATATSVCQSKCRAISRALKMHYFFRSCTSDKYIKDLKSSLDEDPMLILERFSNVRNNTMPIGWTALHVAVWSGAFKCYELLLNRGANPFECDLTGRLPLHILAASEKKKKGHMKICESLLRRMRQEFGSNMVGDDAPIDLAGLTPSSWLLVSTKDKKCADVVRQLKTAIYSPGDRCISPFLSRRRHTQGRRTKIRKSSSEIRVGHFELPGWNIYMEDVVSIRTDFDARRQMSFFAVFDGHGGSNCSKFCGENYANILKSEFDDMDISNSLKSTSLIVDRMYREETEKNKTKNDDSGAVGVTVLVTPKTIYTANLGDCRAVLCRRRLRSSITTSPPTDADLKESDVENMFSNMNLCNDDENDVIVLALSEDHKAGAIAAETERVQRAGAMIENGELRLSKDTIAYVAFTRAFGDFSYKTEACPALIAEPDVTCTKRSVEDDLFLVLACDGVWDVMSNKECVNFVNQALKTTSDASELCSKLLFRCLEKGSTDNMSCIIVLFDGISIGSTGSRSSTRATLRSSGMGTGSSSGNSTIRKTLF